MATDKKISNLIKSQVPSFVLDDHPNFIAFLEAYYEYLEQSQGTLSNGKVVERAKNLLNYADIDTTLDAFADKLYLHFITTLPDDMVADKSIVLKNAKEYYQSRGTEKSNKFLLNILYGLENVEFYYPKVDILKASDGKWLNEKYISTNCTANSDFNFINNLISRKIYGNTSNASAVVENIIRVVEGGQNIDRIFISGGRGTFIAGEEIHASSYAYDSIQYITTKIVNNNVNKIVVTNKGTNYNVGDYVIFESDTPPISEANAVVSSVSIGDIYDLVLVKTGAGFQVNDPLDFQSLTGSGASGSVTSVLDNNYYHPNTYSIYNSTIDLEANTPLENAIYSNLSVEYVDSPNVDTILTQALSSYEITGLGPIQSIVLTNGGSQYISPTIDVVSNTHIRELGILGRMKIVQPGSGYAIGDTIEFVNPTGFPGFGALANVRNVSGTGAITEVQFTQYNDEIIGGTGYFDTVTLEPKFPVAVIDSGTGTGGEIRVTALLGDSEEIDSLVNPKGAIQLIDVLDSGEGYQSPPTVNLSASGDGTATAYAELTQAFKQLPGRYLDDDGQPSSFNFLQDRHYYQNYSYVIMVKESIKRYRDTLRNLLHPAGLKLFSEYDLTMNVSLQAATLEVDPVINDTLLIASFDHLANTNTCNVVYNSHSLSPSDQVYIEFIDDFDFDNKYYLVDEVFNSNVFSIKQTSVVNSAANGQCLIYIV